jgi:hypothetical protein
MFLPDFQDIAVNTLSISREENEEFFSFLRMLPMTGGKFSTE